MLRWRKSWIAVEIIGIELGLEYSVVNRDWNL